MDSHNWLWVLGPDLQPIHFIHLTTIQFDRAAYAAGGGGRNRRLNIVADAGESIHGLRFWGRGRRFEFDDFAATLAPDISPDSGTVPEPASWAMRIAGFGLVGAVARRRGRRVEVMA